MQSKYKLIAKERDRRLSLAKQTAQITGDDITNTYQFIVAHGLTEALRIIDGVGSHSEGEE